MERRSKAAFLHSIWWSRLTPATMGLQVKAETKHIRLVQRRSNILIGISHSAAIDPGCLETNIWDEVQEVGWLHGAAHLTQ